MTIMPQTVGVQACASVVLDMTGPIAVEVSLRGALHHARRSLEEGSAMDVQLENSPYCTGRQPKPADPQPANVLSQIEGMRAPPPEGKSSAWHVVTVTKPSTAAATAAGCTQLTAEVHAMTACCCGGDIHPSITSSCISALQ